MKNKFTALLMVAVMVFVGVAVFPAEIKAADASAATLPTEVAYEKYVDAKQYWDAKKAPVKEGYVFGGWYKGESRILTFSDWGVQTGQAQYTTDIHMLTDTTITSLDGYTFKGKINFNGHSNWMRIGTVSENKYLGFQISPDGAQDMIFLYNHLNGADGEQRIPITNVNTEFLLEIRFEKTGDQTWKLAIYVDGDYKLDYNLNNTTLNTGITFGDAATWTLTDAEKGEINYYTPLTEVTDAAYAKFVPAQVMSVRAQNEVGLNAESGNGYVRVISSVDSKNYQKVGFEVYLANKVKLTDRVNGNSETGDLESTKVYSGLMVNDEPKTAKQIFGGTSEYLSVWQLGNNPKAAFDKIIYVRPYWVTPDGTTVKGLGKYVHIEDEYKDLVSIPVNVLPEQDVAAGTINMSYTDSIADEAVVGFEAGRIFTEMECKHDVTGKIFRMVGNAKDVDQYNSGETLFANIRIKQTALNSNTFDMSVVKFVNWTPTQVDTKAWDITYVK